VVKRIIAGYVLLGIYAILLIGPFEEILLAKLFGFTLQTALLIGALSFFLFGRKNGK
jgi:hypothetical protein